LGDHHLDAEGFREQTPCPSCGSRETITYRYREGFEELECEACGYRSDAEEIAALTRYGGAVLERERPEDGSIPVPIRTLKA